MSKAAERLIYACAIALGGFTAVPPVISTGTVDAPPRQSPPTP